MKLLVFSVFILFLISSNVFAGILTKEELSCGIINKGDYSRLWKVMDKIESGEPVMFCVIGGSVTEGAGATSWETAWGNHSYTWWKKAFPGKRIGYRNIAIGASCSDFGAYRLPCHLALFTPDIVCIEYSVNDSGDTANVGYEGIIRQCLSLPDSPAVVCVCHMDLQGNNCQDEHMKVIRYYDLPAVSIKNAVWDKCVEGKRNVKDIIADSVHPTDLGHSMLAELVNKDIFEKAKRTKPARTPAPAHKTLPKPYISDELQFPRYYYPAFTKAKLTGWKLETQKTEIIDPRDVYGSDWSADAPGKTLEMQAEGTCISVCFMRFTRGGGSIICYVDGKETATLDCDFTGGWGDYWATRFLARGLENKTHTLTFVSAPNSHGGSDNKVVLTAVMTGGNKE